MQNINASKLCVASIFHQKNSKIIYQYSYNVHVVELLPHCIHSNKKKSFFIGLIMMNFVCSSYGFCDISLNYQHTF